MLVLCCSAFTTNRRWARIACEGRGGRRPALKALLACTNTWPTFQRLWRAPGALDLPRTGCCCRRRAPFRLLRCCTRAAVGARRALQAMAVCILPSDWAGREEAGGGRGALPSAPVHCWGQLLRVASCEDDTKSAPQRPAIRCRSCHNP